MLIRSIDRLGAGNRQNAVFISPKMPKKGLWSYELQYWSPETFSYRYFVKDDNFKTNIEEWGPDRVLKPKKGKRLIFCFRLLEAHVRSRFCFAFIGIFKCHT